MKKLNLGCGLYYKKEYINLDKYGSHVDVRHDLNIFPWPFKDNTFDYILASHIIEHLDNIPQVLEEIGRISKPNSIVKITVPYFNSWSAFGDVTHKHFFTLLSFDPFIEGGDGGFKKLFDYKKKKLIWGSTHKRIFKPLCAFMNWFVNAISKTMEKRFPFLITVEALEVELIVVKNKNV